MTTCIALIRGINVGGKHKLPMKDLKALIEKNGCKDVQTYIQSGNVIFRSAVTDMPTLCGRITAGVSKSHGFEPRVLILTRAELERAAAGNPFPQAHENPKSLHLFFLSEPPKKPDLRVVRVTEGTYRETSRSRERSSTSTRRMGSEYRSSVCASNSCLASLPLHATGAR